VLTKEATEEPKVTKRSAVSTEVVEIGETVGLQQIGTEEANLGQEALQIENEKNVDILNMIQKRAGTNELDKVLQVDNGHVKIVTLMGDTLAGGEGVRGRDLR
jgi:hypothetical protein